MKNERIIVQRAKKNPDHFFALYDHYYPKLFAYLVIRSQNRQVAEDVVQQAFLKALEKLPQFKHRPRATFGSWLFTIARNVLTDHQRASKRTVFQETDIFESHPTPIVSQIESLILSEDEDLSRQRIEQIMSSLNTLQPIEKEVVLLKYISGLSYKEIARVVAKKPNTLAVMLRRSLQKIRKELDV